jgi:hypothetical protein
MDTFRVKTYIILLCLAVSMTALAQESLHPSTNKATLIGIGSSSLYDTYLSPLTYKGTSIHLSHERMKKTSWMDGKLTRQQIINLEVAWTDNPAKNASEYSFMLDFNWGGHYNLIKTNKFRLGAGGLWNISGGVLYNQRNSNNPASARAYSNINLSAIAFYNWKSITFRAQVDTPLFGIAFSPHYRQSYYEISLGNSVNVVNFVSIHNQRALRSFFTADIPIQKIMLRVGYLGSFYQTKMQNIQTHNYSNSFVIGLVSESINLSGNKIKSSKLIDSAFY